MRQLFKKVVVAILKWESKMVLAKYSPEVIAITGSVGKTSTKDAIYHVLALTISARKSAKSFNSDIGLPLTILGLENAWRSPLGWFINIFKGFLLIVFPHSYPKLLVLEVGADHPGDIKNLSKWLLVDVAVITRLPETPVHVEYFSSPEEVREEKTSLLDALKKGGTFISNADDSYIQIITTPTAIKRISYGLSEGAQVRAKSVQTCYEQKNMISVPCGIEMNIITEGEELKIKVRGVLGNQFCSVFLAAIAVGISRKIPLRDIAKSLESIETAPGRMRIIEGKGGTTIIDDSYNSSPIACLAALQTLKEIKCDGRKIAMLGDMLELGQYAENEHRKVGQFAATVIDELIVVGKRAKWIAEGAHDNLEAQHIHRFTNSLEAGEWMSKSLKAGDMILIKGSQGGGENLIRMERAVKLLMAQPKDAASLLVRQESEWQVR